MRNSKFLAIATGAYASCILVLSFTPPARAASLTYNFRQDGFDEGAYAEGFFVADDLDGDGQIAYFRGSQDSSEVLDFRVTFSGNQLTPPTTYGFQDLFMLSYDLDGGPLGDGDTGNREGIRTSVLGSNTLHQGYLAGPRGFEMIQLHGGVRFCDVSPDSECGFFNGSISSEFVAVPEPSPFWGSIVAIGMGIFAKRKGLHLVRQKKSQCTL